MDSLLENPDVGEGQPVSNHQGETFDDAPPQTSLRPSIRWKRLLRGSAAGWYLSLLFHLMAYTISALVFAWLGLNVVTERPDLKPQLLQASLDEETQVDDLPALQIITPPGPNTEETHRSLQQLASDLAIADRGQLETLVTDARIAAVGSDAAESGSEEKSPFFRIPESGLAVTKGSFTAWTDPANPAHGQFYQIIIEIRLPDSIERYRLTDDLSGKVVGTDKYEQRLPYDSRSPLAARVTGGAAYQPVTRATTVKVTGKKLQLAIKVPPARQRLVKDRIVIKSRRLRESQELVLVFGAGDKLPGLNTGLQNPDEDRGTE